MNDGKMAPIYDPVAVTRGYGRTESDPCSRLCDAISYRSYLEGREVAHFLGCFEDLDSLSGYQNTRAAVAGRLRRGTTPEGNQQYAAHRAQQGPREGARADSAP